MAKFIIQGGQKLNGKVKISGSKNAALPAFCAALLTDEPVTIKNVPLIGDIETLSQIIRLLGAKIDFSDHNAIITSQENIQSKIDQKSAQQLRASILLVGPLLARLGKVFLPHPGGCVIGKRPIDTHLDAFRQMGAKIKKLSDNDYEISAEKLIGGIVKLKEASVTATENVMMAAALTERKTIIKNAACEPYIIDLAKMLQEMGAEISGEGTRTIKIIGPKGILLGSRNKLKGVEHEIIPDELEAISFALAAVVTDSEISIENIHKDNLLPVLKKFSEIGINYKFNNNQLKILKSEKIEFFQVETAPFPGFPTDLQAPFAVLATQAEGKSTIWETMYENRFAYVNDLQKMGAKIKKMSTRKIEIEGPTKLSGKTLESPDIRAGLALVLAALAADGKSVINNIELIDRGYEDLEKKLRGLGAKIERI